MALAERTHRKKNATLPTHQGTVQSSRGRPVSPLSMRSPLVQPKLSVNQPGDKYEQEADAVARAVMMTPEPLPQADEHRTTITDIQRLPLDEAPVQRQCATCESETPIQRAVQATGIAPTLQFKPLASTLTPLHTKGISGRPVLQRKCAACDQEDPIQRRGSGAVQASPSVEQRLQRNRHQGRPLPKNVRTFMEPRLGVDLSPVRVHTDNDAVQLNRDLGAQAFTHGRDIYFGAGNAPDNDALTAHELTHTIQQGKAGRTLQRAEIQRQ